jgi:DNA-binding transcriptional ArsR family regulator
VNDPWEDGSNYVDTELAKALSHPLRVKILGELNKQVMSPSRFAKRFGISVGTAANQFGVLQEAGCIEIVHEDDRGRGVEHWYRATKKALFDDSAWERLPETIRNKLSARTFGDLLEAIAAAMQEGTETFDSRTDRHLAWETSHVDEQAWEEMSLIQREALEKLMQVARESRSRLIRSGAEGLRGTWGVLLFESPFEVPESPGTALPTSEPGCANTRTRGG